jgi:hypothetical protein
VLTNTKSALFISGTIGRASDRRRDIVFLVKNYLFGKIFPLSKVNTFWYIDDAMICPVPLLFLNATTLSRDLSKSVFSSGWITHFFAVCILDEHNINAATASLPWFIIGLC